MAQNEINKRRVLFVDDDPGFLETITKVLGAWSRDSWTILICPNTGKAIALIEQQPVDLVVIDLHMPGVDGLQFLRLLHRKFPSLSKIILTAETSADMKERCLEAGAEFYFQKPTTIEEMENIYTTLDAMVKWAKEEGFSGVMRSVGLQELIQMDCLNRTSTILEIAKGAERGRIYIKDGSIIHAQAGPQTGEEAFQHLFRLKGGEFRHSTYEEPAQITIQGSHENLLMEAARLQDEGSLQAEAQSRVGAQEASATKAAPALWEPPELTNTNFTSLQRASEANRELLAPKIEEFVLCSHQGNVLHEWQSPNPESRWQFLESLLAHTRDTARELPLGKFDRLEVLGEKTRLLVCCQADGIAWISGQHNERPGL